MFTKNHLFSNTLHTIQKNSVLTANRFFPSCPKPLPQSEAKYEAVDKKTDFHKKGFALSLVFKVRVFRTRKRPIG